VWCLPIDLIDSKGSSLDVVLVNFRGRFVVISSVRMRVLHVALLDSHLTRLVLDFTRYA
jgi:hypothetical protein